MNGKQSKKLRKMAELYYNMQFEFPDFPNKKTYDQIYNELKQVHNAKTKTTAPTSQAIRK